MERVLDDLRKAQESMHGELLAAKTKDSCDMSAVRAIGRSFNELKSLTRRLDGKRRDLTKNSTLAALLVTVCRRVLPVRDINPDDLGIVPSSYEGYMQILDFYFFSDASLYCFGEHFSGPNWFTKLKRNIAIFTVRDLNGEVMYNNFAVSGEHRTPGAASASEQKKDLLAEMERVLDDLRKAQESMHGELLAAKTKDSCDMSAVRAIGRSFNELKSLTR